MSARKTSHNRQHSQAQGNEKTRRISQYSKEITNTGHQNHQVHHGEKVEKLRRISQHSHPTDTGDNHEKSDRHRAISHHAREGGHAKDLSARGQGHGHHTGRGRAGSKREHDRHSVATSGDLHPPEEFENTYKLDPDVVFKPGEVKDIIRQVLADNLKGQNYEKGLMASRCLLLSDVIKEKVRQLHLHRFKIVSMVLIGEKKDQSLLVSSRCLWNQSCDNFASCEYSKGNVCAVGMVFAVYQE